MKHASVGQIVAAHKPAALAMPVADIFWQVNISEQTFYRGKKQYAGLQSDQVRELKQLQDEAGLLNKLVAELSLDKEKLRDIAAKRWPCGRHSVLGCSTPATYHATCSAQQRRVD